MAAKKHRMLKRKSLRLLCLMAANEIRVLPRLCGEKKSNIQGPCRQDAGAPGEAGIRLFSSLRLLAANFSIGTSQKTS
jgi:hypothetical protein